jgi:transcriptional regulator with XRE-family HTH domain
VTSREPTQEYANGSEPEELRQEVERLGRILRAARGEKYSLESLAARSGVSAGLLSQIERGIGNPSFQTLLRITSALQLPISELFGGGSPQGAELNYVVRSDERRRLTWPKERLTWEVLTPPGVREFTVLRGTIPPRFRESEFTRPKYYRGMFCDHLLEGHVTVQIDDAVLDINPGDSYTIRSGQMQWLRNDHDVPAVMLTVLSPGAW